jgi:hypothetical protein
VISARGLPSRVSPALAKLQGHTALGAKAGTNALGGVSDDLLARADRAIRESRLTRDEAHKDRESARNAMTRVRATVQLARAEGERAVNFYRNTARWIATAQQEQVERVHVDDPRNR